jgi:hypothetical protein
MGPPALPPSDVHSRVAPKVCNAQSRTLHLELLHAMGVEANKRELLVINADLGWHIPR